VYYIFILVVVLKALAGQKVCQPHNARMDVQLGFVGGQDSLERMMTAKTG
jgi:hypothetical protein